MLVVTGGLVAVGLLCRLSPESMSFYSEAAEIVLAALGSAITLIGIIPALRERLFRWFPRISVYFESPGRGNQNEFVQLRPIRAPAGAAGWFFRLGVRNSGYAALNDADVQVVRVERYFNGKRWRFATFSPMDLHWANAQGDNSRTVYPDDEISDFVDVVHAVAGIDALLLFVKPKHLNAGNNLALPKGQYYLHLRVVGKSNLPLRPTKAVVFVDWSGDWKAVHMELIPDLAAHTPPDREYSKGGHWVENAGFMTIQHPG